MEKDLKRILAWSGASLALLVVIIIINQLLQISAAAAALHPVLGRVVAVSLTLLFVISLAVPLYGFVKLRKPLELPEEDDLVGRAEYLQKLKERLVKNPNILRAEYVFEADRELTGQVEGALAILHRETLNVMNEASTQVFITTAVSQNGSLDSIFVLVSLSRMIWKISHIYEQRPSLQQISYLYMNVAATVLMAREIEDLALLDEQLEPIINSIIGGTLGALVPGANAVANIIVNSVIEGSANAFLTLRVGAMAQRYSGATTRLDRRVVKRCATLEACGLFGTIVQQNTVAIVKAFALASKRATLDKTADRLSAGASRTTRFIKDIFKK